jgi:hypothetical protein
MSEKILHLAIFPILIAFLCVPCAGTARASLLNINVRGDLIDLYAEKVPLIEVIKGICEKTGIIFRSGDPLTELVSLELTEASVEKCLRRLLTRRNYALIFEGKGDHQFVLVSLRVLGAGPVVSVEPEPSAPPPGDPIKRYEKQSFVKMFEDSEKSNRQASATPVKSGPGTNEQLSGESTLVSIEGSSGAATSGTGSDVRLSGGSVMLSGQNSAGAASRSTGPGVQTAGDGEVLSNPASADEVNSVPVPHELGGIRLTRIPKESVLARIGLNEGDIVRDVNGRPIKSTADLFAALEDPPVDPTMIRIERLNKNGLMDPIYIHLR